MNNHYQVQHIQYDDPSQFQINHQLNHIQQHHHSQCQHNNIDLTIHQHNPQLLTNQLNQHQLYHIEQSQSIQKQINSPNQNQTNTPSNNNILLINKCHILALFITAILLTIIICLSFNLGTYFLLLKTNLLKLSSSNNLSQQQPSAQISASGLIINTQPNNVLSYYSNQATLLSTDQQPQWIHFDQPKHIYQFRFDSLSQTIIPFSQVISKDLTVKFIKLILLNEAGNSLNKTSSYRFYTKLRVINGLKQWIHYSYGIRYYQQAISYNSQQLIIPVKQTRQIKIKSSNIQQNGGLIFYIAGYRM